MSMASILVVTVCEREEGTETAAEEGVEVGFAFSVLTLGSFGSLTLTGGATGLSIGGKLSPNSLASNDTSVQ